MPAQKERTVKGCECKWFEVALPSKDQSAIYPPDQQDLGTLFWLGTLVLIVALSMDLGKTTNRRFAL